MAEYEDEDEEDDDDNCHQLTTALLTRGRGKNKQGSVILIYLQYYQEFLIPAPVLV